jgi:putative addiction module killer protein
VPVAESSTFQVLLYQTVDGRRPLEEWLAELEADRLAFVAVQTRIDRLERGLIGDWKSVGRGVYELRVDYGPGYRIYFGRDGSRIVILICGGYKRTQGRDINLAKTYWSDYEKRKRSGSRPV